jgi:sec-independent protein translocase protein TatA
MLKVDSMAEKPYRLTISKENMFGNLGLPEIVIIGFIIILLFGAKKIPDLARGIGKGVSEFKKGLREVETNNESSKMIDQSKQDSNTL